MRGEDLVQGPRSHTSLDYSYLCAHTWGSYQSLSLFNAPNTPFLQSSMAVTDYYGGRAMEHHTAGCHTEPAHSQLKSASHLKACAHVPRSQVMPRKLLVPSKSILIRVSQAGLAQAAAGPSPPRSCKSLLVLKTSRLQGFLPRVVLAQKFS